MLLGIILGGAVLLSLLICLLTGAFHTLAWLWIVPVSLVGSVLSLTLLAFLVVFMCHCAYGHAAGKRQPFLPPDH